MDTPPGVALTTVPLPAGTGCVWAMVLVEEAEHHPDAGLHLDGRLNL